MSVGEITTKKSKLTFFPPNRVLMKNKTSSLSLSHSPGQLQLVLAAGIFQLSHLIKRPTLCSGKSRYLGNAAVRLPEHIRC